jgi:hypothetical protein
VGSMGRGQSISLNTIIIAALALLVLVILSIIFAGYIRDWLRNRSDCTNVEPDGCGFGMTCPDGYVKNPDLKCYVGKEIDTANTCCVSMR